MTDIQRICICFFSGTGCTKHVVGKMIRALERRGVAVDCFAMESFATQSMDVSAYDMLGIAYPVHAFNAPQIVIRFAKQLPRVAGMHTFVVGTMGEDHPMNYAASHTLISKLQGKGYKVFYNRILEMPSNFIFKYDAAKVKALLGKVDAQVPQMAQEIVERSANRMSESTLARFLSVVGKAEWLGARWIGKLFYAKKGCTGCGLCAQRCPNRNITMRRESAHFHWSCGLCMRCVYLCPQKSIGIHPPLGFLCLDEWYDF